MFILFGFTQQAQAQCTASDECFDFTFLGVEKIENDFVRLSFKVKTNCSNDLSNVAFELPNGAGVTSSAIAYSSAKYKYSVENGTNNPFYSIKFEGVGINGYKNGVEDIFTYDLSAYEYSTMKTLRVAAKAATTTGTVMFDLSKCGVATGGTTNGGGTTGGGNNGGGTNGGGNGGANCSTSQPSPITGPYDPCPGDIVTYCITADAKYTSYVWDVPRAHAGEEPTGWVIISGQGTSCVTVKVGEKPGTMKVKVNHSECGTKVRTKPVHPGRTANVDIAGPAQYCPGERLTYTADIDKQGPGNGNGNGGNSKFFTFTWAVPAGWQIVSGQGTDKIVVVAGALPGAISVSATYNKPGNGNGNNGNGNNTDGNPNNGNGNTGNNQSQKTYCGNATDTMPVTPKPECGGGPCVEPEVALVVPDTVCNLSDEFYTFSVAEVQEGVTYSFTLPEGFIVIEETNGSVTVAAIFEEDQLGVPQTITVNATNDCGTETATAQVVVSECAPGNPLPVSLTRFDGVSRNGVVELSWATATEINNDRFEIERSTNGKDFVKIGEVKGAGNSSILRDYTFTDRQASKGTVYYRLNQVDLDNSHEYSKVIAVQHNLRGAGNGFRVTMYPNPVSNGNLNIRFDEMPQNAGDVAMQLVDMSGRVLHTRTLNGNSGEVAVALQSLGLKQGVYMVSLTVAGQKTVQRIVVQ
ncbi:T9SS type A sorting domain-containing protein [Nibribacter ruber]|uniref:T9SS type A sorting domain-containing protein n=1 Tax=Nibribacter ruber TaxID=2698458 RepID=A0A6P1P029_9BACT|nr:T9SS type A sorting domain-containing protein [Nibribacter ruber]QHL87611.1 T9SS type A sorting domain-containing protein [Nibribacter ruber]